MDLVQTAILSAVLLAVAATAAFLIIRGIRVYKEYERGVRFRLGRFDKVIGPGISFSFPGIDRTVKVDTRSVVLEMPSLKAMTRDNATVFADVSVRYRVAAPGLALTKAADSRASLKAVTETTVRAAIGEIALSDLIQKREFINARLRDSVSGQAEDWGMDVEGIEIVDFTPSQRTMDRMHAGASRFQGMDTIKRAGDGKNRRQGGVRPSRR
jgi:regulator of protease activity HflC (stomatin/prohibitin superfamily)